MLQCNKYNTPKENYMIDWNSLLERLREMFPKYRPTSDIEQFIESKQPKSAADVEHYMRQYTYSRQYMKGL
jgi:hypothetical protein